MLQLLTALKPTKKRAQKQMGARDSVNHLFSSPDPILLWHSLHVNPEKAL